MTTPDDRSLRQASRPLVVVTTAGLSLLVVIGTAVRAIREHRDGVREAVTASTHRLAAVTEARFGEMAVAATAARGLFAASRSVERSEWLAFAAALREGRCLDATMGIAFVQRVPRDQLATFTAEVRADGAPDFAIEVAPAADAESAIVRFGVTDAAWMAPGSDLSALPMVADAMARAMRLGRLVASAPVPLAGPDAGSAIVFCMPVYANEQPVQAEARRLAACIGWVLVPSAGNDLVAHACQHLGTAPGITGLSLADLADASGRPLATTVHAGGSRDDDRVTAALAFGDRQWSLTTTSTSPSTFESLAANAAPVLIAATLSALLATVLLSLAWSSRRAHALAATMTKDLRDSETRFRDLADASPVLLWVYDVDSRATFCNKSWFDFTGTSMTSELAQSFGVHVHPEDRERITETFLECSRTRTPWTAEYRLQRADQRYCWMHGTALPRYAHNGEFLGYVGGCIDIDARKRADAAAAEAHARLQVFVDHAAAAVAMFDTQMRYIACSRRWLTDYGLEGASMVGRSHYEVFPEISDQWKAIHRRCLEGAVEQNQADPFDRADGRRQWLRWDVRPWRSTDGTIGGLLMFTEDITAAVEAAHLRETTAMVMEAVAADRPLAEVLTMITTAAEALHNGLRASVLLLRDGCLHLGAGASLPPEYHAAIEGVAIGPDVGSCGAAAFTGERVVVADTSCDPRWAPFAALAARFGLRASWSQPIMAGGRGGSDHRVLGTFAMYFGTPRTPSPQQIRLVEDLAHLAAVAIERCHAAEALRSLLTELTTARRQAEASNLAKSEFLANMSHEIRTPMTAILGFTALLAEGGTSTLSPQERQESLDAIRRNGDHLLAIINDILDISKIEAGKMKVESLPTDGTSMVDEVVSLLRDRAHAKGLDLEVVHGADATQAFLCDPLRLRQILMNLLGNAIKFTDAGRVTVATRSNRDHTGERLLTAEVTDTGIGMTPHQCGELFRPFTQADASTTRRFGGTGLGLRISKRLAEALGGDITVVSVPGQGSTFTLVLPATPLASPGAGEGGRAAGTDVDETPAREHSLVGVRVLLAEDGRDNQRLISLLLQRAGAVVTIAENGRHAVSALCEDGDLARALQVPCPFDLVLMDMQMPEMDGYAAATLLRQKGFDGSLVALTANALAGDRERCLAAGCDDYVHKPVERAVLLDACTRAVAGAD